MASIVLNENDRNDTQRKIHFGIYIASVLIRLLQTLPNVFYGGMNLVCMPDNWCMLFDNFAIMAYNLVCLLSDLYD